MNVLVTGATGFLGSALVSALVRNGATVTALARSANKTRRLAHLPVRILYGDLTDPASLLAACAGQELVYNVAAMVAPWGKRADFYRVNVDGTRNLLEACAQSKVRRLVHVSSLTVLGIPRGLQPMTEASPYTDSFNEYYTETKILSEQLVRQWIDTRRLDATIVRPGIIWGPGDTTFLPRLLRLARRGLIFTIGRGDNVLCLTYLDHLVDALTRAGTVAGAAGQVYNVTDEEEVTSRMFFRSLAQALNLPQPKRGVPFALLYVLAWLNEGILRLLRSQREPLLSRYGLNLFGSTGYYPITKARRDLGYQPWISLDDGMQRIARWYDDPHHQLEDL